MTPADLSALVGLALAVVFILGYRLGAHEHKPRPPEPRYYLATDLADPSLDAEHGFRRLPRALRLAARSHGCHGEPVWVVRRSPTERTPVAWVFYRRGPGRMTPFERDAVLDLKRRR